MKNYNEIAADVFLRRDKYNEKKKTRRKRAIQLTAIAVCFVSAAVFAAGIGKSGGFTSKPVPTDNIPSTQESSFAQSGKDNVTTNTPAPLTERITTTQEDTTVSDEGYSAGGELTNWFCIPALPFDRKIVLTGEAITDDEAKAYFEKNGESIIGSLASSGVDSDSIRISEKGYSHVTYDGAEGKSFEVRQNYRDYLVHNGEELVAIITLWKENGEIYNTPSFGAKWFDDYNEYLKNHSGEELVYVYAGWFEIIIAPDNTYYNPMGLPAERYLEGVEKPYEVFYHEAAVYVP